MTGYRVVVNSEIVETGIKTLRESIKEAEYLAEKYNTRAVKIEGHKTGDLTISSAKAVADYEESKMNIFDLTDALDDLGWNEECINAFIDNITE